MNLIPSKFFITSGKANSKVSKLNAFDVALIDACISEQNLVAVSSVIPIDAVCIEKTTLPMGAVTHCILSQIRGSDEDVISAGIAYAFRKDGQGGYVAEGHLYGSKICLEEELKSKMEEMYRIRNLEYEEIVCIVESLTVPPGEYGCCLASLVFSEYR